ncbi:MAG: tetratricopeptide repeat protein [Candidatus Omnitrophica bacterium]|nr:tetratricopeptide repeat protein [Candidatus Omnitrophota bacterium]
MESSEALYEAALSHFRSGDVQQAVAQLEKLLSQDSQHPDALEAVGIFYAKLDRLDDAIQTMKRLTKVSPNHIMAHTNLSRFYAQKGMILEAEQEQAEARRLSWKAELKTERGTTRKEDPEAEAKEQAEQIQERIHRYLKVIELDPKDVLGYFSLGTAYLDAKRLAEARKAFESAILVDPNHSPSYFSLGVTLESLQEAVRSAEIYRKGIQIADARGDMIPLKKMQARLAALKLN